VAAIPPVLTEIQRETGLSAAAAGVLTALPVLCFGFFALATPALIKRLRMVPLLVIAVLAIVVGSAIRLGEPLVALFAGTVVLGAGIAIGNVLVPGLIKRDFPRRAAAMVGLYSVGLSLSGATAAGLTVPIEDLFGGDWRPAVAIWGIGALFAAAFFAPRAREERAAPAPAAEPAVARALWRDRLAWNVTLFMGLQSVIFYTTLSWLPSILESDGLSRAQAGAVLSFSFFPAMLASFATPMIQRRLRRQSLLVSAAAGGFLAAFIGLIAAPTGAPYLWAALLGLSQGVTLTLSLGFIVARAPDTHHASHLSTMAQGVGYLIAAAGPFLFGALHEITSSWTSPIFLLVAVLVPMTIVGFAASREGHVLE
jgi:MFS transporter, CP family, cyanate transporter